MALDSDRSDERRHRRGPRGGTKHPEIPTAASDWNPSLEEAKQQAVRFRMERDVALVERQHALDALKDLQAASARATEGAGIGMAHHVPPSAFTAELLKRDALIEQASREFRYLVNLRESDHTERVELHTRCTADLLAAEKCIRAAETRAHEFETAAERITRSAETRAHESDTALAAVRNDLSAANTQAAHTTELLNETRAKLGDADKAFVAQRALRRAAEINLQKAEHSIGTLLHELRAAERAHPAPREKLSSANPTARATTTRTTPGPQPPSAVPCAATSAFRSFAPPDSNGLYLPEDIRLSLRDFKFPPAGSKESSSDDEHGRDSGLSPCSHASSNGRRSERSPGFADEASSSSAAKRRPSDPGSPASSFNAERWAAGPVGANLRDA